VLCQVYTSPYSSWTSQEAAKRNADFALNLMKAGYEAQRCFDGMAVSVISRNFDVKDLEELVAGGEAKIAGCNPAFSQFEALAFIAQGTLDATTSRAANAYARLLTGRPSRYDDLRMFLRYSARWKKPSKDVDESRQLVLSALEDLDALIFDPDAYSSDPKLKEKGEAWNVETKARRSENGGRARTSRIAQSMNERLTQYVRLKVAH